MDGRTLTDETAAASTSIAPLLLRAAEAAALCNMSLRSWRARDATGHIPRPVRIGRSTFWRPEELKAWVAAGCPDRVTWEALRE
jgi:predicted DNA-binding transcriptional regulator AlpA